MPVNILPGKTENYDEAEDNLYYNVITPEPQEGKGNEFHYDNIITHHEDIEGATNQGNDPTHDDAVIYQNIRQKSTKQRSVYGSVHYSATGVHSEGNWDPSFLKGISSYPPETDIKLDDFFKNSKDFVSRFSCTPANQRNPEHLKFLLHTVLPYLETKLTKSEKTQEILTVLLRLSCIKECPLVTRYALHIILDLFSKISYNAGGIFDVFIVECESCLKDSILAQTQEGLSTFELENAEDQGLRIFVYSRALMVLYVNVVQGLFPVTAMTAKNMENFNALCQKLTDLEEQGLFARKDKARYAIRCIKETIARISAKPSKKPEEQKNLFHTFLSWLRQQNSTGEGNKDERIKRVYKFISDIKKSRKGWFDFHVAVLCLGSQIHEKPRNVDVLQFVIENYLRKHSDCASKWSSEGEWQTGLVLGSVLEYIVTYNQDKDTRTKACLYLIDCFTSLTKPNSVEKLWVRESLQRCLHGPNTNLRHDIMGYLEPKANDELMKERFPVDRSMAYLVEMYKKQIPPGSQDFIKIKATKGYFTAMFRGEKAQVKILVATKGDLILEGKKEPSRIHKQLVIEAYALRRLNSKPHPNIVRVFAYDTSAQPYHLITEHVSNGSLLQYLHSLRSQPGHMPGPSALTHMMLGVTDALIYLNKHQLVHLAITAANVLVGQDSVCKLTGFQFAREMTKQSDGSFQYISLVDEMAIRHAAPECFTSGQFSEMSVSWAIGILLFEMHTYGVSPYNQYSNDKHDQIRRHVSSGGKLTKEACIRTEVSDLMQMCLQFERKNRHSLIHIKIELERIYEQLSKEDSDWPAASYPSLTNVDFDQTKDVMTKAIEGHNQERNLGFFGSPTSSKDIPIICASNGARHIRELVSKTKEAHLERLKKLKNKNIVEVLDLSNHDPGHFALCTEDSGRGNLLQVALAQQCRPETLVTFAAQIAQAMRYMHENDMIHSELRAEHIMVFPDKVKVSRLGRSKYLDKMLDTMKCDMPEDSKRWSPPEVIKDGIYSHSSDVYSFGIMCFELFNALSAPEGSKPEDVKPFPTIKDEQILAYLEGNNRPGKPIIMPKWFHIVVKQCLLHKPAERPPFLLIEDALTSSYPFESCLLSHWIDIHQGEVDNNDIDVSQPETASHVIPKEHHKSFEELHQSVAVEVFLKHTYVYKPGNMDSDLPSSQESSDAPQDDDFYDDLNTYNTAYCRIPSSPTLANRVLQDPIQEQSENVYEEITPRYSKAEKLRQNQSLPPATSIPSLEEKIPIEETGGSTLTSGSSKLAMPVSSPIIDIKSPCLDDHETSTSLTDEDVYDTISLDGSGETSPDRDYSQNVYVTIEDEGAVGGVPTENSWHSAEHSGNQEQEYASLNNNHPDAGERSFYSSLTFMNGQHQNTGSSYSEARDISEIGNCTSSDTFRARSRPVPLPRKGIISKSRS